MSDGGPRLAYGDGLPGTSFVPGAENACGLPAHPLIGPPPRPGLIGAVGRFELLRKIGEGGMGLVFLARDTMPPKPERMGSGDVDQAGQGAELRRGEGSFVALKLLRPELAGNGRAIEYFLKEAEHAQRLQHRNIFPVLESCGQPDGVWMAMPVAEGGSLAEKLKAHRPLPEEMVLQVAGEMAAALEYAHGRGIIHRDIKPQNILFDSDGVAFLSDFGLARSLLNDVVLGVEQTDIAGTPVYQSPTAASGEHGDTRDDIYSFGAVLYEMLTGLPPYRGDSREDVLRQIQNGPPPPNLSLNPNASPGLVRIAEGALARDLRDRYAHIRHVREDLELVSRGKPPKGPHGDFFVSGTWARIFWAKLRRPEAAVSAVVVVLVSVVLGPIWLLKPSLRLWRSIDLPEVHDWTYAQRGSLKNVQEPVFHLVKDNRLLTVSVQGQICCEWTPPAGGHRLALDVVRDISGDGATDLIVDWCKGEESIISVIQNWKEETYRYAIRSPIVADTPSTERPTTVLKALAASDLDHDDRFEVVALGSGARKEPRSIYCVRFPDEELVWTYQTGPWIGEVAPLDLDGDGVDELLVGSLAVDNGVKGPDGSDDNHSYLFAFDQNGRCLWRTEVGGIFTRAYPVVSDLDNDGKKDVLVWANVVHELLAKYGQEETGPVLRLDYNGKVLFRYDARLKLSTCITADMDRDGREEVLVIDRQGFLHMLNSDLQLVRRVQISKNEYHMVQSMFAGVADVTGDQLPEVVLVSSQLEFVSGLNAGNPRGEQNVRRSYDSKLIVMDGRLKPVGEFRVFDYWPDRALFRSELFDVDGDGRSEVLIYGPSLMIVKWCNRLHLASRQ
ncbi:MAG: protein kinase domain-containing protein [Verrucomicrobiia bacterium]